MTPEWGSKPVLEDEGRLESCCELRGRGGPMMMRTDSVRFPGSSHVTLKFDDCYSVRWATRVPCALSRSRECLVLMCPNIALLLGAYNGIFVQGSKVSPNWRFDCRESDFRLLPRVTTNTSLPAYNNSFLRHRLRKAISSYRRHSRNSTILPTKEPSPILFCYNRVPKIAAHINLHHAVDVSLNSL